LTGAPDKPGIVLSVAGQVFGQKGLSNGGSEDETKVLQAQIKKLEKIIGRQMIAIKTLENSRVNLREEDEADDGERYEPEISL